MAMGSNANHNGRANGHRRLSGRPRGLEEHTTLERQSGHARVKKTRPIPEHPGQGGFDPPALFAGMAQRATGKLRGKVAVITGADSGIGRAVTMAFAREGADVAILYHGQNEEAEATRKAVEDMGRRALIVGGDVADEAFCKRAAQQIVGELGKLDILVSNEAIKACTEDVQTLRREQLERTFQVNVFGYFFMVQACLPFMSRGSSIIATGSETGIFGSERLPDYSATSGAIHALTRSLAQQLLPRGIRVNAVAPGPVQATPDADDSAPPLDEVARTGRTGPGRPPQPEEVAAAYVFFASNADSGFITGQVLAELGQLPA